MILVERKGARIPDRVTNERDDGDGDGDGGNERIEVGLIRGGDEVFSLRWVEVSS